MAKKGFNASGRMSVERFERMFIDEFDVYCDILDKNGQIADQSATLASLRPDDFEAPGKVDFSLRANMQVANVQKKFKENFGIDLQIYKLDKPNDKDTLASLRKRVLHRGETLDDEADVSIQECVGNAASDDIMNSSDDQVVEGGISMEGQIVKLSFGMAIPTMVEDEQDEGLLLEAGDGIEEFRFDGTDSMDENALSQWVYDHFDLIFDGDLDDPERFKSIRCVGVAEFGGADAVYDDEQGLVLSDLELYMNVVGAEGELDEAALEDLFHLLVLRVKLGPAEMTYSEFEDYSAEVVEAVTGEFKPLKLEYPPKGE